MNNEVWKDMPEYEGLYKVSNMGRIKSVDRKWVLDSGRKMTAPGKMLKQIPTKDGYHQIAFWKNNKGEIMRVHQAVAIAFLGHKRCKYDLVVNHKNFDRHDNRLQNLEIVTVRENTNQKHLPSASKYTGVTWNTSNKKWMAAISIKGKRKFLGLFDCEKEASLAYEQERIKVDYHPNLTAYD